MKKTVESAE